MVEINFSKIEKKWQKKWEDGKIFETKGDSKKKKFYVLEMFPYPSASGLHMGHALNYTIGDVYARFKRMKGLNVMYPMGFDAFGLPAENAAIKAGQHPKPFTETAIKNYIRQMKEIGLSYDWSKTVSTTNPDYYRWNQYFFLKFLEKDLVYKKKAPVNWCPECKTVLANEQVHNGRCWRHEDTEVEIKELEQWFIKTTDYADELLENIEKLEWPDKIKAMQRNWIGKSYGTEIDFEIGEVKDFEFVFFHGFGGDSKSVFWNSLKDKIECRGGKVVYAPDLPNTDNPDIEEQIEFVLKNYKFNKKTILVTHSLGGVLAMKLLPKLKNKINKLIMIAPPLRVEENVSCDLSSLVDCCDWKFDFEKIKKSVEKIKILACANDPLISIESSRELARNFGVALIEEDGADAHFRSDWEPEVEKVIFNKWQVFTTRPDTIFGVTFMVVSAQHSRLMELVTDEQKKDVEKFLKRVKSVSEKDIGDLEKEGVFTGSYAVNPINGEKVPVYAGNFVVAEYGCGMVMAVPAHDQRDFEFAKKYGIEIRQVIMPEGIVAEEVIKDNKKAKNKVIIIKGLEEEFNKIKKRIINQETCFTGYGILVNSGDFNGLDSKKAIEEITKYLEKKKLGKKTVNYKLRDWLISRQRYWGTPIPIVYCDKCGVVPVSEKDLPIILPEKVKFGKGNPLATAEDWVNVKCPKCSRKARRETDTMDTFFDSSWYFLRYCDNLSSKKPFDKKKVEYWMPVDQCIGGAEHACMHLIYARFFTKALRDLGLIKIDEPFTKLFNQGMLHGPDGEKMSKSRGNVINPDEVSKKYGMDTARFFLLSLAAPDKPRDWSEKGIEGSLKFIKKVFSWLFEVKAGKSSAIVESKINKAIKEVTEDIESLRYNLAIIKIRQLFEAVSEEKISKKDLENFIKLISPFTPHIAEELWEKIECKGFVSLASWPVADVKKIDENLEKQEEAIDKLVEDINHVVKLVGKKVEKAYVYVLPQEKKNYFDNIEIVKKKTGLIVEVFAVNDKDKHDPEGKSKKVKPGRPGIYLE